MPPEVWTEEDGASPEIVYIKGEKGDTGDTGPAGPIDPTLEMLIWVGP